MRKGDHFIAIGLGIEFALITCAGFFAGYFLDKKWDTLPYFTLIGAFCGFVLGFYALIFTALKVSEKVKVPKYKNKRGNKK